MAESSKFKIPQVGLQSVQHEELLNIIDTLRSQGITRYVDLPQLIVCGDQSSGKSSVLEAISGLRFPTKDNLCTRFATELILRRGPEEKIEVSIIPADDRSEEEKEALANFVPPSTMIEDFGEIVKSAEEAMGLGNSQQAFGKDVLTVELCGPGQPHLTLVDLPGIFWAGDRSQTDDDSYMVQDLVKSYMLKKRSIILAVVSAKSDLAMQVITKLARKIDPSGQRTLGIITKPDLLFQGSDSEDSFVRLAKNENIFFKLSWHVLKNLDFDRRNDTRAQRDASEKEFFQNRVWSTAISPLQLGISNLRQRLSGLLLGYILKELPHFLADVEKELKNCSDRLQYLGGPRRTIKQQRAYLVDASLAFSNIMTASIDGIYSHSYFGASASEEGYNRRLRANVQNILTNFAEKLRTKGHTFKIVDDPIPRSSQSSESRENREPSEASPVIESDESDSSGGSSPKKIFKSDYLGRVQSRMRRNRGRELPGCFNPTIIGDLFFEQAKPWKSLVYATCELLVDATNLSIRMILEHVSDIQTTENIFDFLIKPRMEKIEKKFLDKADELLKPHTVGHPLTYNHYFTDNVQKMRRKETRNAMKRTLQDLYPNIDPSDPKSNNITAGPGPYKILRTLIENTEINSEIFAATEAMNAMNAYYKVSLKCIVDAFGMYAVEECLLSKLAGIFSPDVVLDQDEDTIRTVAGESEDSLAERDELDRKLAILGKTIKTMQRLKSFRTPDVAAGEKRRNMPEDDACTSQNR